MLTYGAKVTSRVPFDHSPRRASWSTMLSPISTACRYADGRPVRWSKKCSAGSKPASDWLSCGQGYVKPVELTAVYRIITAHGVPTIW